MTFLRDAVEVRIIPFDDAGDTGSGRIIWIVVTQGRVFVRSWKGESAKWFVDAVRTGRGRITTEGVDVPADPFQVDVTWHPDQDAATAAAIDAEFLRKYGDPYAAEMNLPLAARTTLELLPA